MSTKKIITPLSKHNNIYVHVDTYDSNNVYDITRSTNNFIYYDMFVIGCGFVDLEMLANIKNVFTITIYDNVFKLHLFNNTITHQKTIKLALLELYLIYLNVIYNFPKYTIYSNYNKTKYLDIANNLIEFVKIMGLPFINYAYDLEHNFHFKSQNIFTIHEIPHLYSEDKYSDISNKIKLNEINLQFNEVIKTTYINPYNNPNNSCKSCKKYNKNITDVNNICNCIYIDVFSESSKQYNIPEYFRVIKLNNTDIIIPNDINKNIVDYMAISYMLFNLLVMKLHITKSIDDFSLIKFNNFISPINIIDFINVYNENIDIDNSNLKIITKYQNYYLNKLNDNNYTISDYNLNEILFLFKSCNTIINQTYDRFCFINNFKYIANTKSFIRLDEVSDSELDSETESEIEIEGESDSDNEFENKK